LENGVDIESFDHRYRTPFHYAAQYGNFEVFEFLFLKGANTTGIIEGNFAHVNSIEMLKFYNVLIERNQFKLMEFKEWLKKRLRFLKGRELEEDLKKYILNSELDNVKKLISTKKDELNINVGYEYDYMKDVTPLHIAASINNYEMVEYLLQNGADINSVTNRGMNVYSFLDYGYQRNEVKDIYELLKNHEKQLEDTRIKKYDRPNRKNLSI